MLKDGVNPILRCKLQRFAVVTGANKGIGFGVCKQLASNGIKVVLTARDESRGLEAVEKLRKLGLSDFVVFHQLDVTKPTSIASLVDFIKTQFGKLDILVNNAGIPGHITDGDALQTYANNVAQYEGGQVDWSAIIKNPTYELAEEGIQTNYYGAKRLTEALFDLLQLSDSPRIVNVTAFMGKLEFVKNEWAKGILSDIESLTEEKIDEVLKKYLEDFKEGSLESNGWPAYASTYIISKASLNACTRILAKKFPSFCINSVCPGYTKTDMTFNTGLLTIDEAASSPVMLALLPNGGPSGLFFNKKEVSPF